MIWVVDDEQCTLDFRDCAVDEICTGMLIFFSKEAKYSFNKIKSR